MQQEDVRSDAGDRGAGQIQGREEGEIKVGQDSIGSDDSKRVCFAVEGAIRLRHPSLTGRR